MINSYFVDGCSAEMTWDNDKQRTVSIQKNWVPFIYEGSVLFAQSIYPHRIVSLTGGLVNNKENTNEEFYHTHGVFGRYATRIDDDEDSNTVCYINSTVVAETSFEGLEKWKYGPLRGGSQGTILGQIYVAIMSMLTRLLISIAERLNSTHYIAAFHTAYHSRLWHRTYVMGLYVFLARFQSACFFKI